MVSPRSAKSTLSGCETLTSRPSISSCRSSATPIDATAGRRHAIATAADPWHDARVARTRVLGRCSPLCVLGAAACASGSATRRPPDDRPRPAGRPRRRARSPTCSCRSRTEPRRPSTRSGVRSAPDPPAPDRALPARPGSGPRPLIVFAHGYNGDPAKFTPAVRALGRGRVRGRSRRASRSRYTGAATARSPAPATSRSNPPTCASSSTGCSRAEYATPHRPRRASASAGLSLGGGTTWGLITDRLLRRAALPRRDRDGRQPLRVRRRPPSCRTAIPVMVFHVRPTTTRCRSRPRRRRTRRRRRRSTSSRSSAVVHAEPYEDVPEPGRRRWCGSRRSRSGAPTCSATRRPAPRSSRRRPPPASAAPRATPAQLTGAGQSAASSSPTTSTM